MSAPRTEGILHPAIAIQNSKELLGYRSLGCCTLAVQLGARGRVFSCRVNMYTGDAMGKPLQSEPSFEVFVVRDPILTTLARVGWASSFQRSTE